MPEFLDISIVTVSYGDLIGLERTLESIDSQSVIPSFNIIVASGYCEKDKESFKKKFARPWRIFIFDRDDSLYSAMNIGLESSKGRFVLFLNGGDIFFEKQTMEKLASSLQDRKCNVYRTAQVYGNFRFFRPKNTKMHLLQKYPGHQGFIAPLPEAIDCPFDETRRISADLHWMRRLMGMCGVVIHEDIVSQFELGGVSNRPTRQTVRKRFKDDGIVTGSKELLKFFMFKLLGGALSYLILFYSKYEVQRFQNDEQKAQKN